jgi:hypothetical protein
MKRWQRCVIAFLLLLASGAARAQETREHELLDLEEDVGVLEHMKLRLTLANRFVGSADFGAFDASSNQPEGRLRLEVPVARNAIVRLMATGRALLYDFDGSTAGFGSGDEPFERLYSAGLRLQAGYLFDEGQTLFRDDERWAVVVQGGANSSWEGGSDIADGIRGGGSIAAGYRIGDWLEIAAGVSLGSRLSRGGIGVSPLLEFDWQISDAWKLKSYGLGLQLERSLGERFTVFARARAEGSKYRLDDRGGTIGKGTLSVRQVPAALGVDWRISRFAKIRLLAGAIAYHRLRLRDENRTRIGQVTADGPSPYVTLRIDLRI